MLENEVIIVNGVPKQIYENLINDCVKYSIISLPFTINRMNISNVKQRVLNIAKGKIAEALFKFFCEQNNIPSNFALCTTPFWTVDRRDFLLHGDEWDIKNNFIYHDGDMLVHYHYTELPALVPNRYHGDQWSKRTENTIPNSLNVKFLFTFLKNANLINGIRGREFLEIVLSESQIQFIRNLYCNKYKGQPQHNEPFTEEWFWEEMAYRGHTNYYNLFFRPFLVITGYCDRSTWDHFKDTGGLAGLNYRNYLNPSWYSRSRTGSLNFLNGTLWTTITNATCPISVLSYNQMLCLETKKTYPLVQ